MASDRRSCGHQFRLGRASAIKAGAEPATLVVGGAGWTARPAHEVTILMQARLGEGACLGDVGCGVAVDQLAATRIAAAERAVWSGRR